MSNFVGKTADFAISDEGSPKTSSVSESDGETPIKRISRFELEVTYLTDPQTFNTVNKSKQLIMSAGYNINATQKKYQSEYDNFFDNIGTIGLHMDSRQLFSSIYHDEFYCGSAYVERIYNVSGKKIVDLKMIDAKLMDYARDKDGIIVVDNMQNPVGYVMNVGPNRRGDAIPKNVILEPDHIFLASFRIAHFRLFPFGNRFESIGIIEPAYLDIKRKHKIEDAAANSIHNTASYPIIGYVGDSQRSATTKTMKQTLEALKNLSYSRYMVFQHPTQIQTLEVKHSDQIDNILRYFRANQSSASGMALGFSVGTGESVNRSTLSTQQRMLDISLESVAKDTVSQFNSLILDELHRVNNYGCRAKLKWGTIAAEERNDKVNREMVAIDNAVVAPEEVRPNFLTSEGIDAIPKAYERHLNSAKAKPKKIPSKPFPQQDKSVADSSKSSITSE